MRLGAGRRTLQRAMDRVQPGVRSRVMRSVRSSNTGIERVFVARLVRSRMAGFRLRAAHVLGRPDVTFSDQRIAVFLDSCFWHGCPEHLRRPKSNRRYWQKKIASNRARDRRQRAYLRRAGWTVIRVWEHDIRNVHTLQRLATAVGRTTA
jgi:DNA mismatch endonuclease Vsr